MPRTPKEPRYFSSLGGYYVQLDRVRHCLAKGPRGDPEVTRLAWENFHALMAGRRIYAEGDRAPVYSCLNAHVVWSKAHQSKASYLKKRQFCQDFSDRWGNLPLTSLKKFHLTAWLDEHPTWGNNTRRIAINSVVAALNWSREQGLTTLNPLAGSKLPRKTSRSLDCLVTDAQHALVLGKAVGNSNAGFRDLLIALYETGARPGELSAMTAAHYHPDLGAWVLDEWKNAEKTGRKRVIYLSPALLPLAERWHRDRPGGPLFPTRYGTHQSPFNLANHFATYRDALIAEAASTGKPPPFTGKETLYGYRHRFATDWLAAGKSIAQLAELLGTSVTVLEKTYSHLSERRDQLRAALADFGQTRAASVPQPPKIGGADDTSPPASE